MSQSVVDNDVYNVFIISYEFKNRSIGIFMTYDYFIKHMHDQMGIGVLIWIPVLHAPHFYLRSSRRIEP